MIKRAKSNDLGNLSFVLLLSSGVYLFGLSEKIIGLIGEAGRFQLQFFGAHPELLRVFFRCDRLLTSSLPRCDFFLCHANSLPHIGPQGSPFDHRGRRSIPIPSPFGFRYLAGAEGIDASFTADNNAPQFTVVNRPLPPVIDSQSL
jgi:hypothetical protein